MDGYGPSGILESMRSAAQMMNSFQTMNSRFRTADEQTRLFNRAMGGVSQHITRRNVYSEFIDIEEDVANDILSDAVMNTAFVMAERELTIMEVWRD